jgi:hypothetical protein
MNDKMDNPWEQMLLVRANIIDQNKCQSKKVVQPFSNGSLKETLLNTAFNNDSENITVVKWLS